MAELNNVDVVKASTSRAGDQIEEITDGTFKLKVKVPKEKIGALDDWSDEEALVFLDRYRARKRQEAAEEAVRLDALAKESTEIKLLKLDNKLRFIHEMKTGLIDVLHPCCKPDTIDRIVFFAGKGYKTFPVEGISLSHYDYLLNEVTLPMLTSEAKVKDMRAERDILSDLLSLEKGSSSR